jgi:hypothetical protein
LFSSNRPLSEFRLFSTGSICGTGVNVWSLKNAEKFNTKITQPLKSHLKRF